MTELEARIKARFRHLSNVELINRANATEDFKWDDESFELNRRRNSSDGKFDFKMSGNDLEIIINNQ